MPTGNMNSIVDDDEPVAAWTGLMPMTTANLRRTFLKGPMRLVALGALWTLPTSTKAKVWGRRIGATTENAVPLSSPLSLDPLDIPGSHRTL